MAKTLKEAAITTRAARARLERGEHWRSIDPDIHIGYRKGARGGVWLVRWRHGPGYRRHAIGTADDAIETGTLDFEAARRSARDHVEQVRLAERAAADGPPPTVRSVLESYIEARSARDEARGARRGRGDAVTRLEFHVLGRPRRGGRPAIEPSNLADVDLHRLTEADLIAWRRGLPGKMRATARQRIVNDLKAALNTGYADHRERLPSSLAGIIKHGLRAVVDGSESAEMARDNQILSDSQVTAILTAAREVDVEGGWGGDLFRMVVVLAATGARFSQVARIKVGDVQVNQRRLMVPVSRKGRGGKSGHTPVPVGVDVIETLVPVVTGRSKGAPLLDRDRREQIGPAKWQLIGRGPWKAAAELTRPWARIRERAGSPHVVAYSLRHSSIVRSIRAGLPVRLVAALHDTSTTMIEKHYSRWIADGLEELAARAVVPLVPDEGGAAVFSSRRESGHG